MENLEKFIKGIIKERIEANSELFNKEELNKIYDNNIYIKMYVLGLIDSIEKYN